MLGQHRRWWANIVLTFGERLVFTGLTIHIVIILRPQQFDYLFDKFSLNLPSKDFCMW